LLPQESAVPLFLIIWLPLCVLTLGALIAVRPSRHITWLALVVLLTAFAAWVSLPDNPGLHIDTNGDGVPDIDREIAIRQGLDLAGGVKVLLEADLPEGTDLPSGSMTEVRRIVEDRIDSLGALEPVIQLQGERRLIVEIPGYEDPQSAVDLIRSTAQLEFVEFSFALAPGTPITTDHALEAAGQDVAAVEDSGEQVYHTVMTGEVLQTATVQIDPTYGNPVVAFTLTPEGSQIFGDYTSAHVGDILGIVLDGVVISAPRISTGITNGQGVITGDFDRETASQLATQLRYGALPVPLRVDSTSTVGPTLGQISVQESIRAGIIGIAVVLIFMLVYYRLPGLAAALALIVFALLNLMIYKLVPVTMTLPAITGFLISVGTAVDGNILIFERMKEELRAGRPVERAVQAGFERAFPSIRDSNLSTIIICAVLYAFGTSFGAGAVRGFAVTLALGLVINLFTAIIVTRTFLHFIMLPLPDDTLAERRWVLGL
jgi:protein-export membrane protein SecD